MKLTPEVLDGALDAIALIEAATDGNTINWKAVLKHADSERLIEGLVAVSSALRATFAAHMGWPPEDVDELFRAMYLDQLRNAS